jgi:hypothetical protein
MFHVVRGPQGAIVSVHRDPVDGAELLPPNHPEVVAFFGASETKSFAAMDADLVRVLEDLIDVLLRRNVFRITDLPLEAQVKLFERKHFRENLQAHALSLYGGQATTFTPGVDPFAEPVSAQGAQSGLEVVPSDLMPLDWPTDGSPR